jgi:opacity protein-like surface antigen
MNWRRASVLCVPVILMATPSSSADFSSPAHRWSGCHATIQGSYDTMNVSTAYGARPGDNLDGLRATKDLNPNGFGVGGGLGCDWQTGNWVFGILGDGAFAGYAMDRGLIFNVPTLWYVTAGGAWAGLEARNYIPGVQTTGRDENTASGWTVGWGSENALDQRWSIKTETLYVDYGKNTFFTPNDPVSGGEIKTDTSEWVTRIGLTYKLNSW